MERARRAPAERNAFSEKVLETHRVMIAAAKHGARNLACYESRVEISKALDVSPPSR
jgi:hypothetical protein